MGDIRINASMRLVLGLLLIVPLFVFGNTPVVKAKEAPISALDGSTYVNQEEWPLEKTENTLEIKGTTLAWKQRIVWVSPQIADDVANGTNGFRQRTVGAWYDVSQMQIGGREARHENHAFKISEDGNSITDESNNRTNFYKRISGPTQISSLASSAVAQVESRGEFYFLTKDGRKVTGEEAGKIPLEEGTKLVTGKDGHVKMTLPDNTTFTVGPGSDIVIDEFVYDPDNSPKKVIASMTIGVFRWVTGNVFGDATVHKDPAQMKVKLPVVAVGIRGTDFEATVQPDGSGSVVLNFGQLEITENKTGFTFIMNAGEKITFGADGSVSRPMKVS